MTDGRTSFDFRQERLRTIGVQSSNPEKTPDRTTPIPLATEADDVDAWIKSVRALKEKRLAEDEARNRQLEEDILRERKARQDRRAHRSRSTSPVKMFSSPKTGYERKKENEVDRQSPKTSYRDSSTCSIEAFGLTFQERAAEAVDEGLNESLAAIRLESSKSILSADQVTFPSQGTSVESNPDTRRVPPAERSMESQDHGEGTTGTSLLTRSPVMFKHRSSVANRFGSPDLASIIQRTHAPGRAQTNPIRNSTGITTSVSEPTVLEEQKKLEHMTKSRARRKRPTRPTTVTSTGTETSYKAAENDSHLVHSPHSSSTVSKSSTPPSIFSQKPKPIINKLPGQPIKMKQGTISIAHERMSTSQPSSTLIDAAVEKPIFKLATTNHKPVTKHLQAQEERTKSSVTARRTATSAAFSPFSNMHRSSHTTSKSVTSMTGIADLLRSRAGSLRNLPTNVNGSDNNKSQDFVKVWSLRDPDDEPIMATSNLNALRADEVKLILVEGDQNESFLWIGKQSDTACALALSRLHVGWPSTRILMGQETARFVSLFENDTIVTKYSDDQTTELLSVRAFQSGYVIDQLPSTSASLCSGFVFVVIAQHTWLWVGRGSHPGEQQAASAFLRARTPGVHPITIYEGREDPNFWKSLGGHGSYASSSYWRLRRDEATYATSLYSVVEKNVVKREYFARDYLAQEGVHIIDTFFELYISLCPDVRKEDISIAITWCKGFCRSLSTIRPFVPIILVLCPGSSLPRDLNAVFRTPNTDMQRSLRVLELSTAEHMLHRQHFSCAELRSGTTIGVDLSKLDLIVNPQDFALVMGVERQNFERLSAAEQHNLRANAQQNLLSSITSSTM